MANETKNGKTQTESERKEITLRDVQKNAKNIRHLIEGLEESAKSSSAIRRAVNESKIIDLLKSEIAKLKDFAVKIATKDFEV